MPDRRINAYAKGMLGEARACEYLQQRGMVLLEKRYRSPFGEIDLVMREGEWLVFVEVKTRQKAGQGRGLEAITPAKQRRLVQTALCYLAEHPADCPIRFDALEITPDGILHLPNAFEAGMVGV